MSKWRSDEIRKKAVVAMEFIARQINDEQAFMPWLSTGVPDGEIELASLDFESVDDSLIEDDNFENIVNTFLRCMADAQEFGLYIDGKQYCNDGKDM